MKRYTRDLCLPAIVANYVERLLCILPPQFASRVKGTYPAYEARAMAYIIFVLKLMFGLDDRMEYQISNSAKKLNKKIGLINRRQQSNEPKLFVWSKWTKYIEMRKIINDVFNPAARERTNNVADENNTDLFVQNVERKIEENMEKLSPEQKIGAGQIFNQRVNCLQTIFKDLLKRFDNDDDTSMKTIPKLNFEASLMPATKNLETILEYLKEEDGGGDGGMNSKSKLPVKIPDYMRVDHSNLNMRPFINVQPLKELFQQNGYHLKIRELEICDDIQYLGIFCTSALKNRNNDQCSSVDNGGGIDLIESGGLQFTTKFANYSESYYKQIVQSKTNKKFAKAKSFSEVCLSSLHISSL